MNVFLNHHLMLLRCFFLEIRSKAWEKTWENHFHFVSCLPSLTWFLWLNFCLQLHCPRMQARRIARWRLECLCMFLGRCPRRVCFTFGGMSFCSVMFDECGFLFWARHQMLLQCCFFEIRSKAWEKTVPMLVLGCLSSLGFCSQNLACSFTVRGCRREGQQDGDWSACGCSLVDVRGWYVSRLEECMSFCSVMFDECGFVVLDPPLYVVAVLLLWN